MTNDEDAGMLMGITRASVIELAGVLGIPVRVAPITIEDLRAADELFFTGTAVEVTPIKDLDGQPVDGGSARSGHHPRPAGLPRRRPGTRSPLPPLARLRPW